MHPQTKSASAAGAGSGSGGVGGGESPDVDAGVLRRRYLLAGVEELIAFYKEKGNDDKLFRTENRHLPKDPRLHGIYKVVELSDLPQNEELSKWSELHQLVKKRLEKRSG